MPTNLTVTKHNSLINASYRLSTMEIRIVLYGLSLINPLTSDFPIQYKIDVKKFANFFKLDQNWLYQDLKACILGKFWEREFSYVNEDGKTVKNRWLIQVSYKDNDAFLEIAYNPLIKHLLQSLKSNFTSYNISYISAMKSVYSIRIYELCIMQLKRNLPTIEEYKKDNLFIFSLLITDLRNILELENKYKIFRNLKMRVLNKAKDEINKYSDLKIDFDVIKVGRSPHEIKFTVKLKKTNEHYVQKEIELKKMESKEKERRANHRPVHSSSNNITTLSTPLNSLFNNIKKNME